jgi:hypothetical protein
MSTRQTRALLRQSEIDVCRFWDKVARDGQDKCWPWQAGRNKDGYGYFHVNGATRYAHRVAYVLAHGTLDPAMDVCHSCDNPCCVNPRHLWAGTNQANVADKVSKGRSLHGVKNPKCRLKADTVRQIVQLRNSGLHEKNIAQQIGCNRRTVSAILTGRQWAKVSGLQRVTGQRLGERHPKATLTALTVREIVRLGQTKGASEIAALLQLPRSTAYSVLSGQTWGHVTGIVNGNHTAAS